MLLGLPAPFAGPMLRAGGSGFPLAIDAHGNTIDGVTNFDIVDKWSCRDGQEGTSPAGGCPAAGFTIVSGKYAGQPAGYVDNGRVDPYHLKNWVLTW